MKAIILSAGQGRRLLPLTERVPKCMLPVRGRPLIGWQIDTLARCGIDDVTVVVGFGAEAVETGARGALRPAAGSARSTTRSSRPPTTS